MGVRTYTSTGAREGVKADARADTMGKASIEAAHERRASKLNNPKRAKASRLDARAFEGSRRAKRRSPQEGGRVQQKGSESIRSRAEPGRERRLGKPAVSAERVWAAVASWPKKWHMRRLLVGEAAYTCR
eukprot:6212751-Pleurochrysis_carterae.AAC.1